MPEIRLLIVDDHEPTRAKIVQELSSGGLLRIVGEAQTSDEALKISRELLPDVVLLDVYLPGLIGPIDLVKRLSALRNVKVVMFGTLNKPAEVQDLLDAGAVGYILKTDTSALIRMALLMVSRGSKGVVSPALPRHVTRLLPDERILLHQIVQRGKFSKAAQRMGVSESEVLVRVTELCAKLDVATPEHLVKWAKKQGFGS
jgi:DNA-binding NarL/FixJ family response regulator